MAWGSEEEKKKFAIGALFGSEFVGGVNTIPKQLGIGGLENGYGIFHYIPQEPNVSHTKCYKESKVYYTSYRQTRGATLDELYNTITSALSEIGIGYSILGKTTIYTVTAEKMIQIPFGGNLCIYIYNAYVRRGGGTEFEYLIWDENRDKLASRVYNLSGWMYEEYDDNGYRFGAIATKYEVNDIHCFSFDYYKTKLFHYDFLDYVYQTVDSSNYVMYYNPSSGSWSEYGYYLSNSQNFGGYSDYGNNLKSQLIPVYRCQDINENIRALWGCRDITLNGNSVGFVRTEEEMYYSLTGLYNGISVLVNPVTLEYWYIICTNYFMFRVLSQGEGTWQF